MTTQPLPINRLDQVKISPIKPKVSCNHIIAIDWNFSDTELLTESDFNSNLSYLDYFKFCPLCGIELNLDAIKKTKHSSLYKAR